MIRMRSLWVAIATCLALAFHVEARTWHVPSEARTVQAGIDSARAGDEVLLARGAYTWTSEGASGASLVTMKAGVRLRGEAGATETVSTPNSKAV